jgi:hypothetical protein
MHASAGDYWFFLEAPSEEKRRRKKQQQTTPGISEQRWWDAQIERGSLGEEWRLEKVLAIHKATGAAAPCIPAAAPPISKAPQWLPRRSNLAYINKHGTRTI